MVLLKMFPLWVRKVPFWNIPKIYPNIQRYTKIYKIPSGGEAAPPGPGAGTGPAHGAGAGPGGAAPPPLGILYLGISLSILDMLGYIWICC